ncbi:MAG TPA: POTRA domain-containing protein [Kofleriaceae bacterium]|nr:POTRA domain-containing protein [Kofleriaceae bacterium]
MKALLMLAAVAGLAGCEAQAALATRGDVAADPVAANPRARKTIESVAIDGDNLPLAALRDLLSTRPGDAIDPQRLAEDRSALERALEARGYLAAKVAPAEVSYGAGSAFVTFPIEQGVVFKVRSVRVTGANDRDAGVVTLVAGDDAIASRIEHARQLLSDHLARRGKPHSVTVSVDTDLAAAAVDVELIAL